MGKQVNENIGHIVCLIKRCSAQAAVRRNRSGKYYFDCPDHGRITPNLPEGQSEIMEHATIWGAGGPPAECARWIAEQWSWGRVMRDPDARKPVNGESPVNESAPVDEVPPVNEPAPSNGPGMPPPPPAAMSTPEISEKISEPMSTIPESEEADEDEDEFA